MSRRALLALAVVLGGCRGDYIWCAPLAGPPFSVDPTTLPIGTAELLDIVVQEGESETHPTRFEVDDPTIVTVVRDPRGFLVLAAREGDTVLHLHADTDWEIPLRVVAQP